MGTDISGILISKTDNKFINTLPEECSSRNYEVFEFIGGLPDRGTFEKCMRPKGAHALLERGEHNCYYYGRFNLGYENLTYFTVSEIIDLYKDVFGEDPRKKKISESSLYYACEERVANFIRILSWSVPWDLNPEDVVVIVGFDS